MPTDDTTIRFSPEEDQGEYTVRPGEELIRPIGAPNTAKDFKKILSSKDKKGSKKGESQVAQKTPFGAKMEEVGERQEGDGSDEIAFNNNKSKKSEPVFSLFDLQKNAPALVEEHPAQLSPPPAVSSVQQTTDDASSAKTTESPFHLASKAAKKEMPRSPFAPDFHAEKKAAVNEDLATPVSEPAERVEDPKTNRLSTHYMEDRPNYAFVNPFAAAMQTTPAIEPVSSNKVQQAMPVKTQMAEIARQLIEKMYIVERSGNTDTIIELKYPPLFQGANLTVTSYDSAKGELNISFTGLTQEAQKMIDDRNNQINLLAVLHDKGYNVHIISTSTRVEEAPQIPEENRGKEDRRSREERRSSKEGADTATT